MPTAWAILIVILWLAVLVLSMVVLGLLRKASTVVERIASQQQGGIAPMQQGPPVGTEIPHFTARDLGGEQIDDRQLRGRSALLVFLKKGCGPCEQLAGELGRSDVSAISDQLVIVTNTADPESMGIPEGLRVVHELDDELTIPLAVQGTPFAIAIDPDGIVRVANVPNTLSHLRSLVAAVAPAALR